MRLVAIGAVIAVLGACSESKPAAEEAAAPAAAPAAAAPVDHRPNAADAYARIHESMGREFFEPLFDVDTRVPLRIVNHAGREETFLGRMGAMVFLNLAAKSIFDWDARLRDPAGRAKLLAELTRVKETRPFDVRAMLPSELAEIKRIIESGETLSIFPLETIIFEEHERPELIRQVEQAFDQIDRAWDAPDAEKRLNAIAAGLEDSKAHHFVSGTPAFHEQMTRARHQLDSAIAAMQP